MSIISLLIFVIITVYDATESVTSDNFTALNILPDWENLDLVESIMAFPVLFMAFNFLYNFFPIVQSLKNPNNERMRKAGFLGTTFPLIVYIVVAFLGYLIYGKDIGANYLKTVNPGEIGKSIYIILQACYIIVMLMSYPLVFYEARNISLYYSGLCFPCIRKYKPKKKVERAESLLKT